MFRRKHTLDNVEAVAGTEPNGITQTGRAKPTTDPSIVPPSPLAQPLSSRDARLLVLAEILRTDGDEPNAWINLLKGVGR